MIHTVKSYDYYFILGKYFSEYELIETYEANNLQCVIAICLGQIKALFCRLKLLSSFCVATDLVATIAINLFVYLGMVTVLSIF